MNSLEKSQSIVDSLTFGEGVNFDSYLHPDDQAKVKQASHWREKLKDFQFNPQKQSGKLLPFSKAANHFRIRPSETTIHTGYNGHKKSLMLGSTDKSNNLQTANNRHCCCMKGFLIL